MTRQDLRERAKDHLWWGFHLHAPDDALDALAAGNPWPLWRFFVCPMPSGPDADVWRGMVETTGVDRATLESLGFSEASIWAHLACELQSKLDAIEDDQQ